MQTIPFFVRIKEDDKLIQEEGVDSLSEAELREDCRERGMLGLLSVEEMRQQVFLLWTIHDHLCYIGVLELDDDTAVLVFTIKFYYGICILILMC